MILCLSGLWWHDHECVRLQSLMCLSSLRNSCGKLDGGVRLGTRLHLADEFTSHPVYVDPTLPLVLHSRLVDDTKIPGLRVDRP
jgi:hypothetical protein